MRDTTLDEAVFACLDTRRSTTAGAIAAEVFGYPLGGDEMRKVRASLCRLQAVGLARVIPHGRWRAR